MLLAKSMRILSSSISFPKSSVSLRGRDEQAANMGSATDRLLLKAAKLRQGTLQLHATLPRSVALLSFLFLGSLPGHCPKQAADYQAHGEVQPHRAPIWASLALLSAPYPHPATEAIPASLPFPFLRTRPLTLLSTPCHKSAGEKPYLVPNFPQLLLAQFQVIHDVLHRGTWSGHRRACGGDRVMY